MQQDTSQNFGSDKRVVNHLELLKKAASGQLEKLSCPSCKQLTVSVSFTQPEEGVYRTWFLCESCDFAFRCQNPGVPEFYSAARRRSDLEEKDRALLKRSIFPPEIEPHNSNFNEKLRS